MNDSCKNPIKPNCPNENIVVYIQIGQERCPICCQCWAELAESNAEWNETGLKTENNPNHPAM